MSGSRPSSGLAGQARAMFLPPGAGLAPALLAVATIGLMFKQLRLVGGALGPFEALALVTVAPILWSGRRSILQDRRVWLLGATLASFCAGALVARLFFPVHVNPRDLMATLFVGLIVLGWLALGPRLAPALDLMRGLIGVYALAILLGVALASGPLGFLWYKLIVPWRLQGLSDNPNQLASLCIVGAALGAIALARKPRREVLDLALFAATVVAGLMSESFAFIFGVTLAPALAALATFLIFRRHDPRVRRFHALFYLACLILGLLFAYYFGPRVVAAVHELYYGGTGKGVVRFAFWLSSFNTARLSPLVGFGPGAHIVVPGFEALQEGHNVLIDLMMSGGLIAVVCYLLIASTALRRVVAQRSGLLLFAALALIEFGLFQTVVRHAHHWVGWIGLMAALPPADGA